MGGLEAAEAEVILEEKGEPEDGGSEEEGVDAVEDTSMAGEGGAGGFDTCATFDGGFEEVAELGGDIDDGGEDEGLPERLGDVEDGIAAGVEGVGEVDDEGGDQDASDDGGDGAFPGFSGAETGGELVFA